MKILKLLFISLGLILSISIYSEVSNENPIREGGIGQNTAAEEGTSRGEYSSTGNCTPQCCNHGQRNQLGDKVWDSNKKKFVDPGVLTTKP